MKGKISVFLTAVIFIFIMMISGCSSPDNEHIGEKSDKKSEKDFSERIEENAVDAITDFSEINMEFFPEIPKQTDFQAGGLYYKSSDLIDVMETGSDGSLYMMQHEKETLTDYFVSVRDGKEKREKLSDSYRFFYIDEPNSVFYAYNSSKGTIEIRNMDFGFIRNLMEGFNPFEIKEMAVHGEWLYILSVSDNPFEEQDGFFEEDDGYVDYGEKLLKVSLSDGKIIEIGIKGIVTMCDSGDRYLYLYVHRDGSYFLNVYDTEKDKIVYSVKICGMGYVFSMAVTGGKIYYVSYDSNGLCSYELKSGERTVIIDDLVTTLGQNDFDIRENCLVFLNRAYAEIRSLNTVNGSISSSEPADVKEEKKENADSIKIGVIDRNFLPVSTGELSKMTGLSVSSYTSAQLGDAGFNEKLLTKLLAGDQDIDIYILFTSNPGIKKIKQNGVCYPLDSSEQLKGGNEMLFDGIRDYFRTPEGKIWGIPLSSSIEVVAAFPDNMEKAGISEEIFRDYFTMKDALKDMDKREGIFIYGIDYGRELMINYNTNKSDPEYSDREFRDFFETMWDGWVMYSDEGFANNPLMGKAYKTGVIDGKESYIAAVDNKKIFDPESTLFHMMDEDLLLSDESLKNTVSVYPQPLLSDRYRQSIWINKVAVLNPNGKNTENAMKVMEALASYVRESGSIGVVYKDVSEYPSYIDTGSRVFKAVYDINKEAIVSEYGIYNDYYSNEIKEYQSGSIDLDTAIKSMQRKQDAYRNE